MACFIVLLISCSFIEEPTCQTDQQEADKDKEVIDLCVGFGKPSQPVSLAACFVVG